MNWLNYKLKQLNDYKNTLPENSDDIKNVNSRINELETSKQLQGWIGGIDFNVKLTLTFNPNTPLRNKILKESVRKRKIVKNNFVEKSNVKKYEPNKRVIGLDKPNNTSLFGIAGAIRKKRIIKAKPKVHHPEYVAEVVKIPPIMNKQRVLQLIKPDGRDALSCLKMFLAFQDGDCFGSRYHKKTPGETRALAIGFPEYGVNGDNIHIGLLVKVPLGKEQQYIDFAETNWKKAQRKILKSELGDCEDVGLIDKNGGWNCYVSKDYHKVKEIIPSTLFKKKGGKSKIGRNSTLFSTTQ